MSLIPPIYNRSQNDIEKLKSYREIGYQNLTSEQQLEWLSGMIGALNTKDLNRIENNIQTIADLLDIKGLSFKTNWNYTDFVEVLDERRIIDNLNKVKERYIFETEREDIQLPLNHYEKINSIEKLIFDMYNAFIEQNQKSSFITSENENFIPLGSTGLLVFGNYRTATFITSRGGNFIPLGSTKLVVSVGSPTIGFETNDGEIFETHEGETFVSNEKIIVKS